MDLEDPKKVIRRGDFWIFGPETPYERTGDVGDVVFPCGWVLNDKTGEIKLYYGAADTSIGLATARLDDLLEYMSGSPGVPKMCF